MRKILKWYNNMTQQRKLLGNFGEDLAVSFLKKKGYKIIDRNVRFGKLGEIDIICNSPKNIFGKKRPDIIFVEVRSKSTKFFGTPEESITPKKAQRLAQLAYMYLNTKKWHHLSFAIDGVFVEQKGEGYEIRHLEDMLSGMDL